jgi:hypothetical protein
MGQFPATALIYRQGLVRAGDLLADISLSRESLRRLEGTPLPQDAALDELRLKDIPAGTEVKTGGRIDPLLHYAGRSEVKFVDGPGSVKLKDLKPLIDHGAQTVTSSTGELKLDYGKGLLTIDAPRAQGVSGLLVSARPIETKDLVITPEMELGHLLVVSLDGQPLASSRQMLLQVMSEEKPTDYATEPAGQGLKRIVNIGKDPWLVKELKGQVRFKGADTGGLKVTALDFNGYPTARSWTTNQIQLEPHTVYYRISR